MFKFILQNPLPPVEVPAEGPPLHGTRIVGGFEAEPYERGYQAFLSGGGGVCGAAVISELFVLTAAHCIPKKSDARMTVTVGIHDRRVKEDFTQTIPVAKTFVHPRYKPKEGHLKGDIALLKLEEKVHMNDKVFPIKLPTRNVDEYMEVVVTGWGRTLSEVTKPLTTLQEIVTRTIPLKECENYFRWVDKSIFCTTAANWDVGPCNGDSGGPAMHEGYLVGLVSFSTKGCKTAYPQGFTNVYFYLNWIKEKMGHNDHQNKNLATFTTEHNGCGILDMSLVLIVLAQLYLYWI
nr:trypsin-2-like [Penaeus vannamei]